MATREVTERATAVELAMEIIALAGSVARAQTLIVEHGRRLAGLLDHPKNGTTRAA